MSKKQSSPKPKREKDFLRKPRYEGGSKALRQFVTENLRYPVEALEKKIQGDVHVKYDVDENGLVTSCKVARAIGGGCDEEAVRIVKMLRYLPARNRGAHVTTHHDIVIHFRLPLTQVQPDPLSIVPSFGHPFQMQYTYVPSVPSVPEPENAGTSAPAAVFTWVVQQRKP